jgi:hypothetical protein
MASLVGGDDTVIASHLYPMANEHFRNCRAKRNSSRERKIMAARPHALYSSYGGESDRQAMLRRGMEKRRSL